jgi:hypothetical protein
MSTDEYLPSLIEAEGGSEFRRNAVMVKNKLSYIGRDERAVARGWMTRLMGYRNAS